MSDTFTPIFFAAALKAAERRVVSRIAWIPFSVNLIVVMKVATGLSPWGELNA